MARTGFGPVSWAPDSCSGLHSNPTHSLYINSWPSSQGGPDQTVWRGQCAFIPIARKMNQDLWATTTIWRTDYYLCSKPMIICFGLHFTTRSFNLFLDDVGIIRNSFPINSLLFYLAWNNKAYESFYSIMATCAFTFFPHHCRNCQELGSCPTFKKICISLYVYKYGDPNIFFWSPYRYLDCSDLFLGFSFSLEAICPKEILLYTFPMIGEKASL